MQSKSFTLIEVVVAIFVITLGVGGIAILMNQTISFSRENSSRSSGSQRMFFALATKTKQPTSAEVRPGRSTPMVTAKEAMALSKIALKSSKHGTCPQMKVPAMAVMLSLFGRRPFSTKNGLMTASPLPSFGGPNSLKVFLDRVSLSNLRPFKEKFRNSSRVSSETCASWVCLG